MALLHFNSGPPSCKNQRLGSCFLNMHAHIYTHFPITISVLKTNNLSSSLKMICKSNMLQYPLGNSLLLHYPLRIDESSTNFEHFHLKCLLKYLKMLLESVAFFYRHPFF